MMKDYEKLIADHVYEGLREKLKGKVTAYVDDDTLVMKVTMLETEYTREIYRLAEKTILGQINVNDIVDEFCKKYQRFIMKGYFR